MKTPEKLDSLINLLGSIKNLRRRGWIKRGVSEPESDADHMYSMALNVLLLAPDYLDRCHCLELALTHDLPEIYATDFVPNEISKEEKRQLELRAAKKLSDELNFAELYDWFVEFEEQRTDEARFVYCLDKLDAVLTAAYYEKEQRTNANLLNEFAPHAISCVSECSALEKTKTIEIIKQIWESKDEHFHPQKGK